MTLGFLIATIFITVVFVLPVLMVVSFNLHDFFSLRRIALERKKAKLRIQAKELIFKDRANDISRDYILSRV